ncbi:APC family permease [Brevibacillus fluminis]|uniref:APC family permease n=1 Tax=Brevibacillus fluminis TaxID=511487 RepID=UPI003F8BC3A2
MEARYLSQPRTLKRSLSLFHVIFFGLAYMAPLTIFTTYGVATQASHGMLPAAYIVALIAMAFTAYSYGRMVKVYPMSGSAYTYTQKSLNSHVGFLVGWAILMDYLFLPMINYLVATLYLAIYFPSVPFWVWVISFIVITTVLNILGIKLATNINTLFVIYQFFVLIVFVVLSVKGILNGMGTGTLVSIKPFFNPDVPLSSVMAGASLLCLSFLGFDAVSTLSEETKNPDKTIPKAILLVTLIGGALFIFISYVGHMVYPDYASFKNADTAAYEMIEYVGGNLLTALFTAASLVGFLASAVAAHGSVTRLLYAMGRDSVLPQKLFGSLHPRFKTPVFNIVLVGVLSLTALFVDLVTATSFINFGALVAFTFVNLSVIAHYFVRSRRRSPLDTLRYLILPLIGAGFTVWLWTSLDKHSLILGGVWALCGLIYLMYLTKMFTKRPPELNFDEVDLE